MSDDIAQAEASFDQIIKHPHRSADTPDVIVKALKAFRAACHARIVHDVTLNNKSSVLGRLWAAHNAAHRVFRQRLVSLGSSDPPKPVETRKFIKVYLELLKDAEKWFRALIAEINDLCGPIPALQRLAGSPSPSRGTREKDLRVCTDACYQFLIFLGDMSRWRATERLDKDPTWGPAVGYYELAALVQPASGAAFHQRSIIEIAEKNHLRAVHDLYRSVVVDNPHPAGLQNLAVEMKSLKKKWGTPELSPTSAGRDVSDERNAFIAWFLRLHTIYYLGEPFEGLAELETEVRSHLGKQLNVRGNTAFLQRVALINMAAERTVLMRLKDVASSLDLSVVESFYSFQKLNIDTFSLLLDHWDTSMQSPIPGNNETGFTLVILLRLYSRWLLANNRFLTGPGLKDSLKPDMAQLWSKYAKVLNTTATNFPVSGLPDLAYMAEEDVEVLGFKPVEIEDEKEDTSKPRFDDEHVSRLDPGEESRARVRDLLHNGLKAVAIEGTPFILADGMFVHTEAASTFPDSHLQHRAPESAKRRAPVPKPLATTPLPTKTAMLPPAQPRPSTPFQQVPQPSDPMEEEATRMVDTLVGPDTSPKVSGLAGSVYDASNGPTQSSFLPTPPSDRGRRRPDPIDYMRQSGHGYASGPHSPLLYGNGGPWSSTAADGRNLTPPNGQGHKKQ